MKLLLVLLLVSLPAVASAVVIRHDVDDSKYRVRTSEFPALVDMPGEAHGVLIAPEWVVTAAHTIPGRTVDAVTLNGKPRKVERVFIHPGYRQLPNALITEAIESGDASKAMEFQVSNKDIALLKLVEPVRDVTPAILYSGSAESGKRVKLVGKGATGNGRDGEDPRSPHRGMLRRAFNRISIADEAWLGYVFDTGRAALPLEGMGGGGDSGGPPLLIKVRGRWKVAGLAAWKFVQGDAREYRPGIYGQVSYNVRLSSYAAWIDSILARER